MTTIPVTLEELEHLVKEGHFPEIDTPTGFEKITDTYRKEDEGFILGFDDGSSFTCAAHHLIMDGDDFVYAKNLKIGSKFNSKVLISKEAVGFQEWVDFSIDASHETYYFNGMLHHNSGKSLMIFLIAMHYINVHDENILIVVPTTGLVAQMYSDFVDYGMDPSMMHQIQGGSDKTVKRRITVATWQSLIKLPREFFDRFGVVIGDEAHKFTAKSLTTIMGYLPECRYRHGFTGTIKSDSKCNKLTLEGVFGKVRKFTSTSELIKDGTVAEFDIKAMLLHHPEDRKKELKTMFKAISPKKRYTAEREYIVNNHSRNTFIKNLVHSLKGQNVLVLFDLVEKHGKVLNPLLAENKNLEVHYIHGGVKADERERIRQLIDNDNKKRYVIGLGETELHIDPGTLIGNRTVEELRPGDELNPDFVKNNLLAKAVMPSSTVIKSIEFKDTPDKKHIVLASYGTTSTGWSCKRIDAVVFAFAGKAEITTLQSIGRGLRKGNGSDVVTLYDISDSLLPGSEENYTLSHFKKRLGMYSSEKFKFKIFELDLPQAKKD